MKHCASADGKGSSPRFYGEQRLFLFRFVFFFRCFIFFFIYAKRCLSKKGTTRKKKRSCHWVQKDPICGNSTLSLSAADSACASPSFFLSFLNNASREDARIIVLLKTSSDRQLAWQYTNQTSAITGITSCVVQSRSLAVHNECPTLRCARPW